MSDIVSGNDWEFVSEGFFFYFFLVFSFSDVGVDGVVERGVEGGGEEGVYDGN